MKSYGKNDRIVIREITQELPELFEIFWHNLRTRKVRNSIKGSKD